MCAFHSEVGWPEWKGEGKHLIVKVKNNSYVYYLLQYLKPQKNIRIKLR
jgi:hypothetical protein